jgi:hypothetical protein
VEIEKGNTQKGVNKNIIHFLRDYYKNPQDLKTLFDAPCGQGEFLKSLKHFFPGAHVEGQDLFATPLPEIKNNFHRGDLKTAFLNKTQKFDVITCISGVMVFDNVSGFVEKADQHLSPGGLLIVTNDNILTLRDRLSFLFFGRLKRFKLAYDVQEGNWNVMLIQGIWKLLRMNKFEVIKVEYTSHYAEDLLFAPLALVLYPLWWLYIRFSKGEMDQKTRQKLFPFSALLARHYIIYSKKI